ncbi:MAG: hypothetical protein U9P10_08420 [Thermodesulfobacteriota bacterium]|nr:hypothetical protein [Thermodesulfobacteriota bacterium]
MKSTERMKRIIGLFFLVAPFFAAGFPLAKGYAVEYRLGSEIFLGLFREENFLDTSNAAFDYDETYTILGIYPDVSLNFNEHFTAYALAELEWFYSWDAEQTEDENEVYATLSDIFVNFSAAGLTLDIGLQPFTVGRGVIFYSDEPGISLGYDGWQGVNIRGEGFRVFDHSPMATLTLGYQPGFLESVEIIGAWYHDADNKIAELYIPFYKKKNLKTSGHFFWAGLQTDFFVRELYISASIIQQFGSVQLDNGTDSFNFDVSAYLIDLEAGYNISKRLTVGAFFFSASGDSHPTTGKLHAFVSPMPFNPRTAIFFNGGFERYDIEDAVLLGGVTWDGVSAPGIRIEYQPDPRVVTELVAAALFPQTDLFDTEQWYGWEVDARVSYTFYQNHQIFFETGILRQGGYFEPAYGFRPDDAVRVAGGLHLVF